jgi:hypothetical protein
VVGVICAVSGGASGSVAVGGVITLDPLGCGGVSGPARPPDLSLTLPTLP